MTVVRVTGMPRPIGVVVRLLLLLVFLQAPEKAFINSTQLNTQITADFYVIFVILLHLSLSW